MEYDKFERTINQMEGASRPTSLALPSLMRKVYLWMTLALVITGLTSYEVATSQTIIYTLYSNQAYLWGIVIAELALVMIISAAINRLSLLTATLLFILYSALNGVMCSSILILYTAQSVASTFFITAGTFAVMAFIGYTTKTDLSSLGKIALMGLIGIIIATVVNIFIGSSMMTMIISYIGVAIFVALTAYDVQRIRTMLAQFEYADESAQKVALIGALSLYLDFINLFLYLIRTFGDRRD